jgi:hypothetical protein
LKEKIAGPAALGAAAWAVLFLVTGCGGTGSSDLGSRPTTQPLTQALNLVTHWPAAQATQIALDAAVAVSLDGVVIEACLRDGLTRLEERDTGQQVPGNFHLEDGGHVLVFRPTQLLREETWYTFRVSPLLCDVNGRLLEEENTFSFYTLDQVPPAVTAANVTDRATAVTRNPVLKVTFTEDVQRESVVGTAIVLADDRGTPQPVQLRLLGNVVSAIPLGDLAGNTTYSLRAETGNSGVTDLAGNPLQQAWSIRFTTEPDTTPPTVLNGWPGRLGNASPLIQPWFVFSESMDLDSAEKAAFQFFDNKGGQVDYTVAASPDRRTIRLVPKQKLISGRFYSIGVVSGKGSMTDLSGHNLTNNAAIFLTVGTDEVAPTIKASAPGNDEAKVSLNVQPVVTFGEAVDLRSINELTVTLSDGQDLVPMTMVLQNSDTELLMVPAKNLVPGRRYTLTLAGGGFGVRDVAGNFLGQDEMIRFTTSTDGSLPRVIVSPTGGSTVVPQKAKLTAVFNDVLDPTTVNSDTVIVVGQASQAVEGKVTLHPSGRIVEFTPAQPWSVGIWYTMTLRHGPNGIRKLSGNWSTQPVSTSFKATATADITAPLVEVTLNSTGVRRNKDLTLPPSGFDINIFAEDVLRFDLDLSSMKIEITGPGESPLDVDVLRDALIGVDGLRYNLPSDAALLPGDYTLTASVADLAGNVGKSIALPFRVAEPDPRALPLERTEVVWARFDLDRDVNGRSDFEDDLMKLGLTAEGDPAGTNKMMIDLVRDGIIRQGHVLFERRPSGGRIDAGSIGVLLTAHQPFGVLFSQIACGGLDPNGAHGRKYGDKSTGVLGRAFFDYRNAARTDLNIGSNPGLGIFGGEMFLFQVEVHKDLYPSFVTAFARRFLKLVPEMGGTPVGKHFLDAKVLSPTFDPNTAKTEERRRWQDIMHAADDWATVISIILVHEVGHTIGMTAAGPNPYGLHGGSSLHNNWPGFTDIMTSAVAYDTLVSLQYRFRDLNLAYLRQRILMK